MEVVESKHWRNKKRFRKNIEPYMIKAVIRNGLLLRDRLHLNVLNAMAVVPQTGKTLKVVFRKIGRDKVKLITAYYLD